MLRNDIVNNPTETHLEMLNQKKTRANAQNVLATNRKYLSQKPLDDVTEEEMQAAKELLKEEIEVVKQGMNHGDLAMDAYTKVWEECYGQVICVVFFSISHDYLNYLSFKDNVCISKQEGKLASVIIANFLLSKSFIKKTIPKTS